MGYLLNFKREDGAYLRAHLIEKNELEEWLVAIRASASGFSVDKVIFLDEMELLQVGGQIRQLHRSLEQHLRITSMVNSVELLFEHDGLGHYDVVVQISGQFPHHQDLLALNFRIDQTELLLMADGLCELVVDPELIDSK